MFSFREHLAFGTIFTLGITLYVAPISIMANFDLGWWVLLFIPYYILLTAFTFYAFDD